MIIDATEFLAERKKALKNNGVYKMLEHWVNNTPEHKATWVKSGKSYKCTACGQTGKLTAYCPNCGRRTEVEEE